MRCATLLVLALVLATLPPPAADAGESSTLLVFTKTAGYRHASIPDGVSMLRALGAANGFGIEHSEDAGVFTDESLSRFAAVVFLSTTGDVLEPAQQEAFERFVRDGGSFIGIHAAADTEYEWPWYGELVGARFENHPEIQPATVTVVDRQHPSTKMLPESWQRTDEWYNYDRNPRGTARVLLTLDEATYEGGAHGDDHPIAWCHEYDGGRAWYTGGGHTKESYDERLFREHVLGGIRWALRL